MQRSISPRILAAPAPSAVELPLYKVAHGRTGDKGNQLNVSVIPHCRTDLARLQCIITPGWVMAVLNHLLTNHSGVSAHVMQEVHPSKLWKDGDISLSWAMELAVDVYMVPGVAALNIVVKDVLDGGVTCSRRLDRHGKSLSDLILSQVVMLPEY